MDEVASKNNKGDVESIMVEVVSKGTEANDEGEDMSESDKIGRSGTVVKVGMDPAVTPC